jgi:hypothetical protein
MLAERAVSESIFYNSCSRKPRLLFLLQPSPSLSFSRLSESVLVALPSSVFPYSYSVVDLRIHTHFTRAVSLMCLIYSVILVTKCIRVLFICSLWLNDAESGHGEINS